MMVKKLFMAFIAAFSLIVICGTAYADGSASSENIREDSFGTDAPAENAVSPIGRLELSGDSIGYTGEPVEPEIRVYTEDGSLISGDKYSVSFSNNTDAGTAGIMVTGLEEYEGQILEGSFTIRKAVITDAVLKYAELKYTGAKRTQTKTTGVYCGEKLLTRNKDYRITYQNNTEAGTATMKITGRGNYKGTLTRTFEIIRLPLKSLKLKYTSAFYTGKSLKPGVTVRAKQNGKTVVLTKGTGYRVSYKNNKNVGTATVTVTGTGNYTGTLQKTFKIRAVPLSRLTPGDIVDKKMIAGREDNYFKSCKIRYGDGVYERINGRSYYENPDIALSDLRYLKVLHYNFSHKIQVGEIIVNKAIAGEVKSIFRQLFDAEYEIGSMYLIDRFWTGDPATSDDQSCHYNNTSAFCYRAATNDSILSRHAYGMAIDINPQQNPYVWLENGKWVVFDKNSKKYIDRTCGDPHMILKGDLCYRLFTEAGFSWGGERLNPIDYQHFEK